MEYHKNCKCHKVPPLPPPSPCSDMGTSEDAMKPFFDRNTRRQRFAAIMALVCFVFAILSARACSKIEADQAPAPAIQKEQTAPGLFKLKIDRGKFNQKEIIDED